MENKLNSETSCQHSETHPTPCPNGCDFFGATMNMCSKCCHNLRLKEEQAATVVSTAVGRSMSSSTALQHLVVVSEEYVKSDHQELKNVEKVAEVAGSKKLRNRCGCCNKKVGIMGFKCRCGTTFCGSHRYPEEHKCSYDYKSVGRDEIAKANPLVIADKIQRF